GDTKLNPIDLVDVAKAGLLILCDGGHQSARAATSSVVVSRRPQSGNRTECDHRNNSRGLLLVLQEPFEIGCEPCPQPVAQFGWRNIGSPDLSPRANLVTHSSGY